MRKLLCDAYYAVKPLMPDTVHMFLRRRIMSSQRSRHGADWPILESAGTPPVGWQGWPDGKQFALVLTHDVEGSEGRDKCRDLASLERDLGFRSAFYFVPERYETPAGLREELAAGGFEVGVHGLLHDGKLYRTREIFRERAARINQYLKDWGAVGFRSPLMHHNLEWLHDLNVLYDASTFDTDPFEPQPDGAGTIFPFTVTHPITGHQYVELPYSLPQDSTLFLFMQEPDIRIWTRKLRWIADHGGMAMIITHPDYMSFQGMTDRRHYPVDRYRAFLEHLREEYAGAYWLALPREVATFCSSSKCEAGTPANGETEA
jgi:peptidoglycan/xylan/chitin deacetylase (PgdA/CDA1 family)